MIYFRLYLADYEGATTDLPMLEDGAYFRLLRHYYRTEAPLPLNSDTLARICRAITLEERAAVDAVLDRYFIRHPDGWHNERADHEIAVSKTARENGSRGGRPVKEPEQQKTGPQTDEVTGSETGKGGGSGQPFSLSTKTTLATSQPLNQPPSARAPRAGRKTPTETGETWEAYSSAHLERYGEPPVRNSRVNGQIANFVRCVGISEAPAIAAFYVRNNRAAYVQSKHSTSLLARDAEGLRTEWATNRRVSETEARQGDRTMATGNAFGALLEEAEHTEQLDEEGGAQWFTSQKGILDRGRKHGLAYDEAQHFHEFRALVFKAEGVTDQMLEAASGSRGRAGVHIRARKAGAAH